MPILTELRARPFLIFALVLGITLSWRTQVAHLLFIVPLVVWLRDQPRLLFGMAVFTAAGLLLSPEPVTPMHERGTVRGNFKVVSVPRTGQFSDWCLVESEGKRYALFLGRPKDATLISLGDRLHIDGSAKPFRESSDQFWLSKGAIGIIQFGENVSVQRREKGPPIFRWGLAWRDSFRDFTHRSMHAELAELVDALCFNVDSTLEPGLKEDLRRTGTVHIVSASGLHVMIFALTCLWALSRLPIPRLAQLIILLFILFLYAGATGFRPPVIRSVIMAGLILNAYLFRREGDMISAAGIAATGQLLADPWSVYDIGFYLSFITVIALSLYIRPGRDERAKQLAQGSWVASLSSAPIVGYAFGSVSVISVVANLAIGIVILPIVAGTMALWLISLALPAFAQTATENIISPFASYLLVATHWMAQFPFAAVELPPYSAYWIPVFYGLMLMTWNLRKRPTLSS